jgi:hypothetical protein
MLSFFCHFAYDNQPILLWSSSANGLTRKRQRLRQPAMARGLWKDPSKVWKTREQGIGTFPIPK